jgi:transcriptional regulator GlxA family with amidase domain
MPDAPLRVGLLAYDGCFASEILALADTLTLANRVAESRGQRTPFATSVHAARPGPVRTGSGTIITARAMTQALDTLVVPGFDLDPAEPPGKRLQMWQGEIDLIGRAARRSLPIASICVGAFLLAESGLLDGRRATTAWLYAETLATGYPTAIVDRSALLVEDGPIITTGAFGAATDLALHMIRLHAGAELARTTARIGLAPRRSSQAPYVDEQILRAPTGVFSTGVRNYLRRNLAAEYDLNALAHAHQVSTRSLLRRFRAETGQTPLEYLQSIRIAQARRALETTVLNIDEISRGVGYGDTSTFRRLFARTVGVSPSIYRKTFGDSDR